MKKFDDDKLKILFENLPVLPGIYYNYILSYKDIIAFMFSRDVHYVFVDLIYKNLEKDISYPTFLKIIQNGELDKFWGTFKFNKHIVLYLKKNSYTCFTGVSRSSITPTRITTSMLLKSSMKSNMKLNLTKIDSVEIEDLYLIERKTGNQLILFTNSNNIFTSINRKRNLANTIIKYYNNYIPDSPINIIIISPVPLHKDTLDFLEKEYLITTTTRISPVVNTHFNGLTINLN